MQAGVVVSSGFRSPRGAVSGVLAVFAGALAFVAVAADPPPDGVAAHCDGACVILNTPDPRDGIYITALWPGGVVPYRFESTVTAENRAKALAAIAEIESVCPARFVPHSGEADYVVIRNDTSNNAWVGVKGGEQYVGIWTWDAHHVIVHEFIHCLGAWHEHQRADRDLYVTIDAGHASPDPFIQNQFSVKAGTEVGWYDFDSVMHYPRFAHSADGHPTIEPKPGFERWRGRLGQVNHLSAGDIWLLNEMYKGALPPAAFDLMAPAPGSTVGAGWSPEFTWTAADLADSYRLIVDDDPFFGSPEIEVIQGGTSFAGGSLADDRLYYWTVEAQNAAGTTQPWFAPVGALYTGMSVPSTLHVDDSAPAGGDGASWAAPLSDLQDALALAECAGGAPVEILVGQGVYTPARGSGDRDAAFELLAGVTIRGGYQGYGSSDPASRDLMAYPTVLSGDLAGDDGPAFANNSENSYNVVRIIGQRGVPAVLDGLVVTSGNASAAFPFTAMGGGLWADDSTLELRNCDFIGSSALMQGGGAHLGASDALIVGCAFLGNRTLTTHSGLGGGLSIDRGWGAAHLEQCVFSGNAASGGAGAFLRWNSASAAQSRWLGNAAASRPGGGLWALFGADAAVSDCVFSDNSAPTDGGGAAIAAGAQASFLNCLFSGNRLMSPSAGRGGAIWAGDGAGGPVSVDLINCTFSDNSGFSGGALGVTTSSTVTGANCILWGNLPGEILLTGTSSALLTYSNVQGGWGGVGNMNEDPQFVDPLLGDWRPAAGSPCIDSGDTAAVPAGVTTDLAGMPRFVGIIDMGSYEFQDNCYADCDSSGALDFFDFLCFQNLFAAGDPQADCDSSGGLDFFDFLCFQNAFAAGCP